MGANGSIFGGGRSAEPCAVQLDKEWWKAGEAITGRVKMVRKVPTHHPFVLACTVPVQ
jgi:hypothetical protein